MTFVICRHEQGISFPYPVILSYLDLGRQVKSDISVYEVSIGLSLLPTQSLGRDAVPTTDLLLNHPVTSDSFRTPNSALGPASVLEF